MFRIFSALGVIFLFFSCKGKMKGGEPIIQDSSIEKIVAELDPNASLIFQDSRDHYWFGSSELGVYRYDGKQLRLFDLGDGLISLRIIKVQEDEKGNIYFDTPLGISVFDGQRFSSLEVEKSEGGKNNWVLGAADLWFSMGWDHKGPFRYDGEKLYQLEFPKSKIEDEFYSKYPNVSYSPYGIYSIFKDSKGHIWFGTSSMGIYRFDGEKISWMYERHLTETPKGGAFGIRSIAEDKEGFFWICNTDYKYKILADSVEETGLPSINYQRETGIQNQGKETSYYLSMLVDDQGVLWMITSDDGLWRNDGKELRQYPIRNNGKNVMLSSIYKDNQGTLWASSQGDGIYKYNGLDFEK